MNEIYKIIKQLEVKLKEAAPELEIVPPWENCMRRNPQAKSIAAISIGRLKVLPAALGEFCSESLNPCRKIEVSFQLSLCAPSAAFCWELWEKCMHKLMFASGVSLSQAECGEAVWKKEWGGVVLPIKICCEFLIGKDCQPEPLPEKIQIVRKGEIL